MPPFIPAVSLTPLIMALVWPSAQQADHGLVVSYLPEPAAFRDDRCHTRTGRLRLVEHHSCRLELPKMLRQRFTHWYVQSLLRLHYPRSWLLMSYHLLHLRSGVPSQSAPSGPGYRRSTNHRNRPTQLDAIPC